MLEHAGIDHEVVESGLDDGQLRPGQVGAVQWVAALAYLKAAAAVRALDSRVDRRAVVLGADTVVVDEGEIIGQPRDRADAERILRRLIRGEHEVVTGVAMVDLCSGQRELFVDRAHVTVGNVNDAELETYLSSDHWRGKAGAYNLAERVAAGWPIVVVGDPGTVMGLPMRKLRDRLAGRAKSCVS